LKFEVQIHKVYTLEVHKITQALSAIAVLEVRRQTGLDGAVNFKWTYPR